MTPHTLHIIMFWIAVIGSVAAFSAIGAIINRYVIGRTATRVSAIRTHHNPHSGHRSKVFIRK